MAETTEPRALSAALAGPAFTTRGGGLAMHVADRHVERWAPETAAGASRMRPLRTLGFVDRMISPWVEAAQRSASLRMFSQYQSHGMAESAGREVSWVFPRPWYQDELDWMAASRRTATEQRAEMPAAMLTTRGTYVAPAQMESMRAATTLPAALYEYVAPSLSVAEPTAVAGVGYGGETERRAQQSRQAYSPMVSLAAVQAADVMSRTVARLPATVASAPALRSVLSSLLNRTANAEEMPTRLSMQAPELVTPPAPRPEPAPMSSTIAREPEAPLATQVAERYAAQHVQIAELQRIARVSAERQAVEQQRQVAERQAAAAPPSITPRVAESPSEQAARVENARRAQQDAQSQVEDRVAKRVAERAAQRQHEQAQTDASQREQAQREQARTDAAQQARTQTVRQEQTREAATRLHEQARTDAATHARAGVLEAATAPTPVAPVAPAGASAPPPEFAAAIASLPPELAGMLSRRPDRAAQTIAELDQAYRTVELLARSAASGGSFEVTRGPRLMMPVGLGGLVATMEQAPRIDGPGAPMTQAMMQTPRAEAMMRPRAPTLPWIAPRPAMAPTSALGAASSAPPAALSHVAWSDRWLARFAGASPRSLDTLSVSTADELPRVLGLAHSAPGAVFVSPSFDAVRDAESVRFDSLGHPVVTRAGAAAPIAAPFIVPAPLMPDPVRVDDNAATPDEVFAAISAAATQKRAAAVMPIQVASPTIQTTAPIERASIADTIANAAPSSPTAGLAAHLAASPFAPALRHVLSIPSATSFDVRALFGGALSASYLAGLIAPDEMAIESTRALPAWASWAAADAPVAERATPSWDPAYVAPDELAHLDPEQLAAVMSTMPTAPDAAPATFIPPAAMTTVRSALLSWDGEFAPLSQPGVSGMGSEGAMASGDIHARAIGPAMARELVAAMSLPMLGDVEPPRTGESWAAPGMMAERAHSWSVAQERSSADLSFDFVSPELLLAARVYGLGPAEAAQAARLAIAGPGQLAAMAGTVDRTFVQAMAFEAERRERATRTADTSAAPSAAVIQSAYPTSTGDIAVAARVQQEIESTRSQSTFGVERKPPRGAFLWPQATVAALKLDAPAPDGQQSMSIAALELLAAQTVAELGTYAALAEPVMAAQDARRDELRDGEGVGASLATGGVATSASPAIGAPQSIGQGALPVEALEPSESDVLQAAAALVPMARRARFDALYLALGRTSAGVNVSPAARAARALALAGRGDDAPTSAYERAATAWDVLPVVYAVELGEAAAAMAESSGTAAASTPGRAAMMQREYGAFSRETPSRDFVAPSDPFMGSPEFDVDVRPGMAGLSARAGEALGSYVAPSTIYAPAPSSSSSSSSSSHEVGAVLRPPTAAQEMVQVGRPAGRFGGGEVEIPTWFEAAARKMFESQAGSMGDGISMAELTLINAVPSAQIAASSRGTASHASPMSPSVSNQAQPGQKIDIEKIANEIYRQILAMMDAARARNGEPYL